MGSAVVLSRVRTAGSQAYPLASVATATRYQLVEFAPLSSPPGCRCAGRSPRSTQHGVDDVHVLIALVQKAQVRDESSG
jgi:hypothetical protein